MASHPRFLGFDEGPFTFDDKSVPVAGVLTRGATMVEAVLIDRVTVDGWDATDRVVTLTRRLPGNGPDRVLIDGITLGGMNVVDIRGVAEGLGVPVFAVARREPQEGGLEAAARRAGEEEKRRRLLPQTPTLPVQLGPHRLFVQAHDPEAGALQDPHEIAPLLAPAMSQSLTPEPLRLAHHIATALVRGVSGTSP